MGPLTVALFTRIEGRSVRRFVDEEIAGPFDLALSIGLDPERFEQAAEAVMADGDVDVGAFFKGRGTVSPTKPPADFRPAQAAALNPPMDGRYANLSEWRAAENPGANGFGNARALAEFYALVLGHSKEGKRLGTPEVMAQARRVRIEGVDQVKNSQARWAAGFAVNEGLYGPNPDTFYHAGWGGTFTLGDPVADLTLSYTPNRMGDLYEREPRRRGLINAVYECLAT
jgi:CubicO group peptidase (beta-lactamase class C family)